MFPQTIVAMFLFQLLSKTRFIIYQIKIIIKKEKKYVKRAIMNIIIYVIVVHSSYRIISSYKYRHFEIYEDLNGPWKKESLSHVILHETSSHVTAYISNIFLHIFFIYNTIISNRRVVGMRSLYLFFHLNLATEKLIGCGNLINSFISENCTVISFYKSYQVLITDAFL